MLEECISCEISGLECGGLEWETGKTGGGGDSREESRGGRRAR
jgi:hypothetical protein